MPFWCFQSLSGAMVSITSQCSAILPFSTRCGHKALSVDMSVNRLNCDCVTQVLDYVKESPYIKSISFNFQTPFPGTESLTLPQDKREEVIDIIIRYKKKGYPVMNTKAGLTRMKRL